MEDQSSYDSGQYKKQWESYKFSMSDTKNRQPNKQLSPKQLSPKYNLKQNEINIDVPVKPDLQDMSVNILNVSDMKDENNLNKCQQNANKDLYIDIENSSNQLSMMRNLD